MKQIINQFTNGLVSDMHPLTTDDKGIVDALNATLITYNGNEMILQNDMGNTLIQDSATGNIMGLSPGFIPIGLKEHGGIMYIASVNKDGVGEIGTIPSPIIRDFYKDLTAKYIDEFIPIGANPPIKITNKLYPADKFIANLRMTMKNSSDFIGEKQWLSTFQSDTTNGNPDFDPSDCILKRYVLKSRLDKTTIADARIQSNWSPSVSLTWDEITTPVLTYADDVKAPSTLTHKRGIYQFKLHTTNEQGTKSITLSSPLYNSQEFTYSGSNHLSNYWYLHSDTPQDYFPKDLLSATLSNNLKTFPTNSKPGCLAISLEPETIGTFGIINRADKPFDVPYTYKQKNNGNVTYYSFFPGFYYTTESGIYVDKLKINVINESTGQTLPLCYLKGISSGTTRAEEQQTSGDYICNFKTFKPGIVSTPSSILLLSPTSNNIYSTDWIFAPKTGNTVGGSDPSYFQIKSDENNTYLLTNQPFITTYQSTTYKSTDKITDVHTGLFCANLGEDWNRWFRLEVEYFDQYDELQGLFTKRFNPYLNDVFGTNLAIDSIDKSSPIDLEGEDITIPEVNVRTNKQTKDIIYKNSALYKTTYQRKNLYLSSQGVAPIKNTFTATWYTNNEWNTYQNIGCTATTDYTAYSKAVSKNYKYIYGWNNLSLSPKTIDFKPTIDYLKLNLVGGKTYTDGSLYIRSNTSSGWGTQSISNGHTVCGHLYITNTTSQTLSNSHQMGEMVFNDWDGDYPVPKLSGCKITNLNTIKSLLFINSNATFNTPTISANTTSFTIKIPQLDHELRGGFYDSNAKLWRFVGSDVAENASDVCFDGDPSSNYLTLTARFTVPAQTITWASQKISAKYKVIPSFTIKGKNDKNESVYISKVHQLDDQWYESNFVCDDSGIPINFCGSSNVLENPADNIIGSSFKSPKYYSINDTETFTAFDLSAGIYVFYMTAKGSASSVCYTDASPYSQILIDIDGKEVEFMGPSKQEYFYRTAGSTQSYYINTFSGLPSPLDGIASRMTFKNQYGVTGNHYQPIVIILPQSCTSLTITMKNLTKGNVEWTYQDAGLFKIKDVSEEDSTELMKLSNQTNIMYYWQYHVKVQQSAPNKVLEPVKYRNYVQKFGVFFRQAYSYKEATFSSSELAGSYYTDASINNIQCADATFSAQQQFVPSNPYEINWILDWRDFKPYDEDSGTFQSTKLGSATALCVYMPNDELTGIKFFPNVYDHTDPKIAEMSMTTQLSNSNLLPHWGDIRILR